MLEWRLLLTSIRHFNPTIIAMRVPWGTNCGWALRAHLVTDEPCAVLPVAQDRFVIGRRPGLDLTLRSPYVSARHLELNCRGGRLFAVDLSSRNGVFVNGERVRRAEVGHGDEIRIGDVEFRVEHFTDRAAFQAVLDVERAEWLQAQFPKLLEPDALTALLAPVVRFDGESLFAYRGTVQSNVSGLETGERMAEAARACGREKELSGLQLHAFAQAAGAISTATELFVATADTQNLQVDLLPALENVTDQFSDQQVSIEFQRFRRRSHRSLMQFQETVRALGFDFALPDFSHEDLDFMRSARILPGCVALSGELTRAFDQKSAGEQRRVRSLIDALHGHDIRVRADAVSSAAELAACYAVGFDLIHGPFIGAPSQIPSCQLLETKRALMLEEQLTAAATEPPDVTASL